MNMATTTTTHDAPSQASQPPPSQLRRMTSFTQRLRGNLGRTSSTAAVGEASWSASSAAEDLLKQAHADEDKKTRPRSFYVPTHAAVSFARTVSPLSPVRIDAKIAEDDLENMPPPPPPSSSSSSCCASESPATRRRCSHRSRNSVPDYTRPCARSCGRPHARTQSTPTPHTLHTCADNKDVDGCHGWASAHHQQQHHRHHRQTEYAAFLADAEAAERAARARIALRKRSSAPVPCRAPSRSIHASHAAPMTLTLTSTKTKTTPSAPPTTSTTSNTLPNTNAAPASHAHRDSAYYSTPSRSSTTGEACASAADTLTRLPAATAYNTHVPKRQPKTLGRRLSEYFKPPLGDAMQGRVCLSH
ncbi:hypothetical protein E4U54_000075 [Claviceps lovelessii]|nr:hypothetical protein E4U54_000075 [Claviceps lovelessii]